MLIFLIAFALSFIGSLPFGMINMAVAHTAINKGIRPGVMMGLGAAIIEFFQVWVALKFTWVFVEGGVFSNIIQVVAMVIFFSAGINFLFFIKSNPPELKSYVGAKRSQDFFRGVIISSFNFIVIPYWVFHGTLLTKNGLLERNDTYILIFAVGAAVGTFTLLICYVFLGERVLRKSGLLTKWVNKFIGSVLIGFGLFQLNKFDFQTVMATY